MANLIIPRSKMYVGETMTREWQDFFFTLYNRVGGVTASTTSEIDEILDYIRALTVNRLVYSDGSGNLDSVDDLSLWVKGSETITSTTGGDGTTTLTSDPPLDHSWSFKTPSGANGNYYFGGHYLFSSSDGDFNPAVTFGSANLSYGSKVLLVQAAGAGGANTVVRVSGTSVTTAGVRIAGDYEDITVLGSGASGAFYQTTKMWLGQVTLEKQSGPDLLCNYGFCSFWDNNGTNFTLRASSFSWLGGASDSGVNLQVLHHKSSGWTYGSGSVPTPPAAILSLATDFSAESEVASGIPGSWVRSGLSQAILGSSGEGVLFGVTSSVNGAFELGNIMVRTTNG